MLAKPIASYYTSKSSLVAKTNPPRCTTSSIIQQCRGLAKTMPDGESGNIPLGTSRSAKRVSFRENVGRSKPQETGLNKTSQQATIDPSDPAPREKPLQRHPLAPETHSSVWPKRIRSEAPDPGKQTAKKRNISVTAPLSTASQPPQDETAPKPRHGCTSLFSRGIMKTPIPEGGSSAVPKRDVSPTVAPTPTIMRVGQEALKMSTSRPMRSPPHPDWRRIPAAF